MINLLIWSALLQAGLASGSAGYSRDDVTLNISAWIARADRNGDAKLSRDEWQAISAVTFPEMTDDYLMRMAERDLAYYDRNGDGLVDLDELAGPSLEGFACLDTDHNGRVSAAEQAAGAQATCLPTRTISD